MAFRIRTHRRGRSTASTSTCASSSSSLSSLSSDVQTPIATVHNASRARVQRVAGPQVAVVGTGREALALSPHSADQFAQSLNMNMALCSSPEVNLTFPEPGVETKPDPVLRRIASDAVVGLRVQSHLRRSSGVPSLPSTSSSSSSCAPRGLPPPPRPHRRRPPPVYVSTGPSLALVEQTYSPFCAPKTPTQPRASSVPPSAVSARSYASHVGSISSSATSDEDDLDLELDLDGLEADFNEYDFDEEEGAATAGRSPLGQTYFASNPRRSRETPTAVRHPLRVQVSIERVAFRDNSPKTRQFSQRWSSEDEGGSGMGVTCGWEDGIKSRASVSVAVAGEQESRPRQKGSLAKTLGRWLKRRN
ncbi:hypothetical protein RHS01_04413 [Rhizoctonia solani]|uniref:Uncharacterized protein n=1 Tax=Rhizoctonia solani TaxID=456999 RepID=A0A8H7M5M0_9AGAM|nr:hypothetical protein RHS01_04413 [Rhizoctonia solani]